MDARGDDRNHGPIPYLAGLLAFALVCLCGVLLEHDFVTNVAVGFGIGAVGLLLSFVMFLKSDDDMRGLKTLLLGALSATSLAKSDQIAQGLSRRYFDLASTDESTRYLAHLYFFGLCCGLLGILGGFLWLRLGLERRFVSEQGQIAQQLDAVPEVPAGPVPELDEFWPQVQGTLPDPKTIDKLAAVKDWSKVKQSDALRVAAVFFASKRWADAERVLDSILTHTELPSPTAFDLYAATLVSKNDAKPFSAETSSQADRMFSRMLTYWADSFLVNLDVGFLYLYIGGKADLAIHYSRRALATRPESKAANMNLACALAQRYGATAPDEVVDETIKALTLGSGGAPNPQRANREGDFTELLKNPKFAAWAQSKATTVVP